jgi:hypothetical protein
LRFKTFLPLITLFLIGSLSISAQDGTTPKVDDQKAPEAKLADLSKEEVDGLRVAESTILVYSGLRGRLGLGQIRKTTVEIGKMVINNPDGSKSQADYERRVLRGEDLEKEKVRFDQKFPNAEYALIYDGDKIFGIVNNLVFTPQEDASTSFKNQIWHGLEALLRYKENGSTVKLEREEKDMGVDFYVVTVTDKENRQTTFYISKKSLRVMKIEYESEGIKYRQKFYDHNYAQGTLVPYRTVLWANDKQIEERDIATITYGQVVGEDLFKGIAQ